MPMVFQRVQTQGISQMAYLIGDDTAGIAALIDPRPCVDLYLQLAREYRVAITHVFETHIHADFMSGARELVERLGSAKLCVSGEGESEYGFSRVRIADGEVFEFGSVLLTARHTPGHTPEHLAYEIAEKKTPGNPWAVCTGDSLLVGSAGRPDLLGDDETETLVEHLFETLRGYYLKLDDGVIIFPCHGIGSACGADIGDRPMTSIGFERKSNPFLQIEDLGQFRKFILENAPPEPRHYRRLKELNAQGPPILGHTPAAPGLTPQEFQAALEHGNVQLLDTRQVAAFGGAHIPGALSIGPRPELSMWAGQMLDYDIPILLVVADETDLEWSVRHLAYIGFTHFAGHLTGGMQAWENAGLPLQELAQVSVHELKECLGELQLLDVRSEQEWNEGRIPGARHHPVAELRDQGNGAAALNKTSPTVTYCATGYRASIAASLLQQQGFTDVGMVPGSWKAWTSAGFEIEK